METFGKCQNFVRKYTKMDAYKIFYVLNKFVSTRKALETFINNFIAVHVIFHINCNVSNRNCFKLMPE